MGVMSSPALLVYISDSARAEALARDTGAHRQWLWQVASGWRGKRASHVLAIAIERATGGAVTRHDLRPDVFGPAPSTDPVPPSSRVAA